MEGMKFSLSSRVGSSDIAIAVLEFFTGQGRWTFADTIPKTPPRFTFCSDELSFLFL